MPDTTKHKDPDARPLSQGDILCDEDNGSVYLFKRFDTMGRIVVWPLVGGGAEVLHPVPPNLHRYEQGANVENCKQPVFVNR